MSIWAQVTRHNAQWGVVTTVEDMLDHVPVIKPPEYWIELTGYNPVPVSGESWWYDHQNDLFTDADPGLITKKLPVSSERFWFRKITDTERGRMWALAQEDAGGLTLSMVNRGRLKAFLAFTVSNPVRLDGAETIFIIDAMETAGAIDPGRADEILER